MCTLAAPVSSAYRGILPDVLRTAAKQTLNSLPSTSENNGVMEEEEEGVEGEGQALGREEQQRLGRRMESTELGEDWVTQIENLFPA